MGKCQFLSVKCVFVGVLIAMVAINVFAVCEYSEAINFLNDHGGNVYFEEVELNENVWHFGDEGLDKDVGYKWDKVTKEVRVPDYETEVGYGPDEFENRVHRHIIKQDAAGNKIIKGWKIYQLQDTTGNDIGNARTFIRVGTEDMHGVVTRTEPVAADTMTGHCGVQEKPHNSYRKDNGTGVFNEDWKFRYESPTFGTAEDIARYHQMNDELNSVTKLRCFNMSSLFGRIENHNMGTGLGLSDTLKEVFKSHVEHLMACWCAGAEIVAGISTGVYLWHKKKNSEEEVRREENERNKKAFMEAVHQDKFSNVENTPTGYTDSNHQDLTSEIILNNLGALDKKLADGKRKNNWNLWISGVMMVALIIASVVLTSYSWINGYSGGVVVGVSFLAFAGACAWDLNGTYKIKMGLAADEKHIEFIKEINNQEESTRHPWRDLSRLPIKNRSGKIIQTVMGLPNDSILVTSVQQPTPRSKTPLEEKSDGSDDKGSLEKSDIFPSIKLPPHSRTNNSSPRSTQKGRPARQASQTSEKSVMDRLRQKSKSGTDSRSKSFNYSPMSSTTGSPSSNVFSPTSDGFIRESEHSVEIDELQVNERDEPLLYLNPVTTPRSLSFGQEA